MQRILLVLVAAWPAFAAAETTLAGAGDLRHDCATDRAVVIAAANAVVTVTGICDRVLIRGAGNTVTIEAAKAVEIPGRDNRIVVDAADRITATGDGNHLAYRNRGVTQPRPAVTSSGDNSPVTRLN